MIAFPASRLALVPLLMLTAPVLPSSPVQQAGPESLVGTWIVDLRPTPDAEAYLQEFVVSGVAEGTLLGTFYGSEVENGRTNADWGPVHFAFVTRDGSGEYHTAGVLEGDEMRGTTHSLGRGFLSVWTARRATRSEAGMDTVSMKDLVGEWTATSRLQVTPDSPVRESRSTASVALVAKGRFTEIRYTWAEGGQPQDGLMLIATTPGKGPADVTWVDSWHMGDAAMILTHAPGGDAILDARGTYPAPSGPDWGWRIVIRPESRDAFRLLMFNITPDGQEMVAVDASYTRRT